MCGLLMYGCFDKCVGVLVICVLVISCFVYVYLLAFVLPVLV